MGATEKIAKWIVETSYEDIPPEVIEVAKQSCFDCLGVMLAGSVQPVGQIVQKYITEQGGSPEATLLGSGMRSSLSNTALANGTMGHALDYDDFGGFGHPTVVTFPPLLALGEKLGSSGRDVLEAYVTGVELGVTLQQTTKYNQMARGFHSTAVIGRMSSAAACSKLMDLDQATTTTALAIAGSMAGGLIHNFGTMTKPLHAGLASRDGLMAAQLASIGMTAGDQIFEHPLGFANTILGEGIYDLNQMADNLGNPYRTAEALIIKKYPCCGGNHGMLDSIFSMMREHEFNYEDVESVEVGQSYLSVVMLYTEPDDELKGKFSALYNTASALVDGEVAIDTFTPDRIANTTVKDTMDKVRLNVQAKWEQGSGDFLGGTPVTIRLKDGRVLEHTTPRDMILGGYKNPWGFENVLGKFRFNAGLALSPDQVSTAVDTWVPMEEIADLSQAVKTLVS